MVAGIFCASGLACGNVCPLPRVGTVGSNSVENKKNSLPDKHKEEKKPYFVFVQGRTQSDKTAVRGGPDVIPNNTIMSI